MYNLLVSRDSDIAYEIKHRLLEGNQGHASPRCSGCTLHPQWYCYITIMIIHELSLQGRRQELRGVRIVTTVTIRQPLPLAGSELVGLTALVVEGVVNLRSVGSHNAKTMRASERMRSETMHIYKLRVVAVQS